MPLRRTLWWGVLSVLVSGGVSLGKSREADSAPPTEADTRVLVEGAKKTRIVQEPVAPLLGRRGFTLQWIGWDRPGEAVFEDQEGVWTVRAFQGDRKGNFVRLVGRVTRVDAKDFVVEGVLDTRVEHMASGTVCRREGTFTFRTRGKRKYWRLQEMGNPCEGQHTVDYVDVYFSEAPAAEGKKD